MLELERRVLVLERLVLGFVGAGCMALLTLGSVLTMMTTVLDGEKESLSLISFSPSITQEAFEQHEDVPLAIAFVIGFAGLLLATIAALIVLVGLCSFALTAAWVKFGRIVAVLLLIGSLVPVLLTIMAGSPKAEDASAGPAMWCYISGVVLYAVIVFQQRTRRLQQGFERSA